MDPEHSSQGPHTPDAEHGQTKYGNATLSDHSTAFMGNVHYVYNFCISPERVASYRRSAMNCFRDSFKDFLGDAEPSDARSPISPSHTQEIPGQVHTVDPVVAANALAADIQEAKESGHILEISEDAFTALFKPSDIVVRFEDGMPSNYMRGLDFDGVFYRSWRTLMVTYTGPDGKVPVTALSVRPMRFDTAKIEAELRARGQRFWTLRDRRLVEYATPDLGSLEVHVGNPRFRYMIDMAAYQALHPDSHPSREGGEILEARWIEMGEPPNEDFVLLLPTTIKGFSFHKKRWENLRVTMLQDVSWNKSAFSQLVLKKSRKELIQALISQHTESTAVASTSHQRTGLKFLFHGAPGTGKTLAAESVAEITERPLYTVTCGDMGIDPESVEKYLESVFFIGAMWGCVILLSDADTFLEQREQSDMHRSALVSTFLRILDNYEGILIFTTTRIGTFDEVVRSRINLALVFPKLGQLERGNVWINIISALEHAGVDMDKKNIFKRIDEFARVELNGRQISHIVSTAQGLARWRREYLSAHHFESIIEATSESESYLSTASEYQAGRATYDTRVNLDRADT